MSTLKAHNIEPATGTDVALGAAGDSITVSGDSLKLDTFKDAGGNTLFTSDGSGTVSSVNSGLKGNGPILIQSQTASSSASISFTSGINSTYDKYMFVFVNIHPATNNTNFTFQVNAVGETGYNETITSTAFQAYHKEDGSAYSLAYRADADQAQGTSYQILKDEIKNDNDSQTSGILYLYAPSSTTYIKHFISHCVGMNPSDNIDDEYISGYISTTAAIDDVQFKMSTGNIDAGIIKMYGIG